MVGFLLLSQNRFYVMGFTMALSILVLCLLIGAMASWSTGYSTVSVSGWASGTVLLGASPGVSTSVYFGLQGYAFDNNVPTYGTSSTFIYYKECSANYCDPCRKTGSAVMGLLVPSFFLILTTTGLSGIRMYDSMDKLTFQIVSASFTFLSWLFVMFAFGYWNAVCFKEYPNDVKVSAGLGSAVSAWVFLIFVFFFHVLTPVLK